VSESRPPDKPLHEVNAAGHRLARAARRYVDTAGRHVYALQAEPAIFLQLKEAVKDYERADKRAQLEATL
jgi:hypothetical protein